MLDVITQLIHGFGDPAGFLQQFGPNIAYFIIFLVIFAESGLLVGFFLPGDTVLIGAGVLAAAGFFSLPYIIIIIIIAAILGDSVGYNTGKHFGPRLFTKDDSIFFHKKHLAKAEHFYESKGVVTIIIARFIPIIRTFAPIVAGIGKMNYRTFLVYNILGGVGWTLFFVLGGYFLAGLVKDVEKYLLPVMIIVVVGSVLPAIWHIYKESKSNQTVI
jgi:membrane-associated protein